MNIAALPRLLLWREEPFNSTKYLREWCFWFYVAEKEGIEVTFPLAEACGRFFLECYFGLDKRPRGYRELIIEYRREWWSSIPRPTESEVGVWELFNLMQELENAAAELTPDFVYKRKGKSRLVIALKDGGRNAARIEFEVGRLPHVFHMAIYHPLTDRRYWPEWFFGYAGSGDVKIHALSEIEEKIRTVFDFCEVFLPVFASCDRATPPIPYDQARGE